MDLRFLTVVPRVRDLGLHAPTALEVVRLSDAHDLDGILFFAGTGAVLDPWIAAQAAIVHSTRLEPLVAVNPTAMHPLTAARTLASLGHLHGRRVDVNLITGTALSDLETIGDELGHDERYARLGEYADILLDLLAGPRPVTRHGDYYRVTRCQLAPPLPAHLRPRVFLAGQSPPARRLGGRLGATSIHMLPPTLHEAITGPCAVHLGVVTRPTEAAARRAAHAAFPPDEEAEKLQAATMTNTDSAWKRALFAAAEGAHPAYWLGPFRRLQADCPYLVAAQDDLAAVLRSLIGAGVHTFLFDLPRTTEDYAHLAEVIHAVRDRGGPAAGTRPPAAPSPAPHEPTR
ncbi:LLM class flavin-dependent oxidoreductase [Streptomyces sp. XM4011]|uniref:LLM class flavin-dependent oxidoreductase n=1 Tax=Streptomyces TaxID=1883 RepID=UPI001FF9BAA5|nr:LLM class flavin-dependent oxidoreductase [Streptomyces sp. XM4011]MCK1813204.1 LLM class flavin-dependent oxidoreductase [Streptomyces sp. XM4011]